MVKHEYCGGSGYGAEEICYRFSSWGLGRQSFCLSWEYFVFVKPFTPCICSLNFAIWVFLINPRLVCVCVDFIWFQFMGTKTAVLAHLHQAQGEPSPDPAILVFKFDPNLELVNRSHFSHFAFNLWLNVPNSVPLRQNQFLWGWLWSMRTSQRLSQARVKPLGKSLGNSWVEGVVFSHGSHPRNECWIPTLSSQLQPLRGWVGLGGTGRAAGSNAAEPPLVKVSALKSTF